MPWVCSHAAKLEQIPTQTMLTDPTQLSKALQNAQKLYDYDAVINIFDPTVEAEACGCPIRWGGPYELPSALPHPAGDFKEIARLDISNLEKKGRLPVILEATRRLKLVLGRKVAIIGVVTGPLAIAASLTGGDVVQALEEGRQEAENVLKLAARVTLEICKAYSGLELDVIVLAEGRLESLYAMKHAERLRSLFRPVWNIVRYHNAYSVLLTKQANLSNLEHLSSFGADGVVVSAGVGPLNTDGLQKSSCVVGMGLPSSILLTKEGGAGEYVARTLQAGRDRRFFITTEWEIPSDTFPENLHEIMKAIP